MDRIKKNYTTKNYIKATLRVLFQLEKPRKFRVKAESLMPAHFFLCWGNAHDGTPLRRLRVHHYTFLFYH